MSKEKKIINFYCVYCKTKKKFDKYIKVNKIKNKYIVDVKKILDEEELHSDDKMFLKIIILNKIHQAMEKGKDIYYIPNFDDDFSIEKLLNIRKILEDNKFNILVFYNEIKKNNAIVNELLANLSKFDHSQILPDY